ncbi:ArsR/SmtB family transcription factor [Halococcoides cellulosivorans]|uniref:Transcriptional regulator n=1 Tax=Halococcoides cellulosivorans TaxID=1679096 RepID=A0A2R4WXQ1_9EURY|nr:metalloregulator ArsR/SmtB family transcription factor [Halococcoides cellulosivorans]AWB26291.1 transcriptional regulator [Halococcoides cellulosivorans]
MGRDVYDRQAEFCSVFSNPKRLRILDVLTDGKEHAVSEIQAATDIPQSSVSRHLGMMRERGVVERRSEGVYNRYRLADPRIAEGMATIRTVLRDRQDLDAPVGD